MTVAIVSFVVSIIAALVAIGSMTAAFLSAKFSRDSANAATRSADIAEIVERGRHYGWRIEARTNATGARNYTLRNVGTVNARNVSLAGQYHSITFHGSKTESNTDIAAGQARLFEVMQAYGDRGGAIDITWTPDLADAEPMTWTEVPPMAPFIPPLHDTDWRNLVKAMEKLAERR